MGIDSTLPSRELAALYPLCRSALRMEQWADVARDYRLSWDNARARVVRSTDAFPEFLSDWGSLSATVPFLADLADAERALRIVAADPAVVPAGINRLCVNPTLLALSLNWRLADHLVAEELPPGGPEPGEELLLVWRCAGEARPEVMAASDQEVFVLKLIFEEFSLRQVSRRGQIPVSSLDGFVDRAVERGIIVAP